MGREVLAVQKRGANGWAPGKPQKRPTVSTVSGVSGNGALTATSSLRRDEALAPRLVAANSSPTFAAEELRAIAYRVRCLAPSHSDPERFHTRKSEIEHELRLIAAELERTG